MYHLMYLLNSYKNWLIFCGLCNEIEVFDSIQALYSYYVRLLTLKKKFTEYDVHMKKNYVEINHNMVYYQRDKGKRYFSVTTPEIEAGNRFIPLLSEVKKALIEKRRIQLECGIASNAVMDGYTNFIFLNWFDNPQMIDRTIKKNIASL